VDAADQFGELRTGPLTRGISVTAADDSAAAVILLADASRAAHEVASSMNAMSYRPAFDRRRKIPTRPLRRRSCISIQRIVRVIYYVP
jgi:energy-coupling factor transporter transmembrane protein EcfT